MLGLAREWQWCTDPRNRDRGRSIQAKTVGNKKTAIAKLFFTDMLGNFFKKQMQQCRPYLTSLFIVLLELRAGKRAPFQCNTCSLKRKNLYASLCTSTSKTHNAIHLSWQCLLEVWCSRRTKTKLHYPEVARFGVYIVIIAHGILPWLLSVCTLCRTGPDSWTEFHGFYIIHICQNETW